MNIKYDEERKALNHYDTKIDYYDTTKLLNAAMSIKTFDSIIEYFNIEIRNKKILDFGCGDGNTTSYINKKYNPNKIVAIDYSENRLKKLRKCNYNNVICVQEDVNYFIEKEEYKNKFDIIFSFEILEHLKNSIYIVNKLKKLLTPTGIIVGTVPLQNKPNNVHLTAFSSIDEIQEKLNVDVYKNFKMRFNNQLVIIYKK